MASPAVSELVVKSVPLKDVGFDIRIPGGGIVTTMVAVVVLQWLHQPLHI
jgi:hypothetical protein